MLKSLLELNAKRVKGILHVVGVSLFQSILFVLLLDFVIRAAKYLGQEDYIRGGVGWGIKLHYSFYIFAALCFASNLLSTFVVSGKAFLWPLMGFALFSSIFVEDLFSLVSAAHPQRALVVVSCAFVVLTLPAFMLIQKKAGISWVLGN